MENVANKSVLPNCSRVDTVTGYCGDAVNQLREGEIFSGIPNGMHFLPDEDAGLTLRTQETVVLGGPVQCSGKGKCLLFFALDPKKIPFDLPDSSSEKTI